VVKPSDRNPWERQLADDVVRALARAVLPRQLRNWLRSPRATAAWLQGTLAHLAGRNPVVELRPGWRLRCHPVALRTAYRVMLEDPAQVLELDGFIAACAPGMVLYDVGAHFGIFSLAALHFGGPQALAVAVDPSAAAARMLRRMARLNATGDRLRIIRAAAVAVDGVTDVVDAGVVAAGYAVRPGAAHPAGERTAVPAVTVDRLCARLRLWPTHLKIDVEGFESDVLRGARATLREADRPLVFIELHNAIVGEGGGDPSAAIRELLEARYDLFDVHGAPARAENLLSHDLVRVVARPHAAPAA